MSTIAKPSQLEPRVEHAGLPAQRVLLLANTAGIAAFFLFFCVNHFLSTGGLSAQSLAFFAGLSFTCLVYGQAFRRAIRHWVLIDFKLPFDMLAGFFVANTLLFIVSLASPLGMKVNALFVFFVSVLIGGLALRRTHTSAAASRLVEAPDAAASPASAATAGAIAVIVSAIAATLWCLQGQTVLTSDGLVVYQLWRDTFIHVREISAFAEAFGAGTLQDIKLAGSSAPIYHFASYIAPAAAQVFTKASAMSLYAGFQLPVGIFLTGVAAFCLASTLWGVWPAVAATVAVVVLPDAYQQGLANRYLSYNFIAQINLGMLYGIAAVALAWIFMIFGCRREKIGLVLLGYVFLLVCAFYKAHIFVANAFLILMYPVVFYRSVQVKWRVVIGAVFIVVFVAAIWATQSHPRIPVMRLDGSGISYYINKLVSDFDPGLLKEFFRPKVRTGGYKPVMAMYAAALLLLCTFGWWLLLAPIAFWKTRRLAPWATLLFPVIIVANYLVMGMGLALDDKQVGTVDELLNRPLVWAYFAVAAWAAGGLYYAIWRNRAPATRWAGTAALAVVVVALVALSQFSKDLQLFPSRTYVKFSAFNGVPVCMVKSAEFIKENSLPTDLVQESDNDLSFGFTALTERQLFAGSSTFGGLTPEHAERLEDLKHFLTLTQSDQIQSFATERKIGWYLLQPSATAAWPAAFVEHAAFTCEGYKVFKF